MALSSEWSCGGLLRPSCARVFAVSLSVAPVCYLILMSVVGAVLLCRRARMSLSRFWLACLRRSIGVSGFENF